MDLEEARTHIKTKYGPCFDVVPPDEHLAAKNCFANFYIVGTSCEDPSHNHPDFSKLSLYDGKLHTSTLVFSRTLENAVKAFDAKIDKLNKINNYEQALKEQRTQFETAPPEWAQIALENGWIPPVAKDNGLLYDQRALTAPDLLC